MSAHDPVLHVRAAHLKSFAQAVGELGCVKNGRELKAALLTALDSLAPGCLLCYEKFDLGTLAYEVEYSGGSPSKQALERFVQLYEQHPYVQHLKKGGRRIAVRPTELMPEHKWKKSALYNEIYAPNKYRFGLHSSLLVFPAHQNLNLTALRDREFSNEEQVLSRFYLEEARRCVARVHFATEEATITFMTACQDRNLTPREIEVIALAFKGRTDKEIAQALGNSVRTVQHQLLSIYRKLRVSTRSEALYTIISSRQVGQTAPLPKP